MSYPLNKGQDKTFLITYNESRGKQVVMATKAIVILLVGFTLASVPLTEAQQPGKFHRIGYLSSGSASSTSQNNEAFRQGLRELGYIEGENIFIEYRYGDHQRRKKGLVELAADLVRLQVDVIVAVDSASTRAARKATSTIPIVMRTFGDPVERGLISNVGRPGGNITGLYSITEELTRKHLQLLKEVDSRLTRVGVLWNPNFRASLRYFKQAEFAATSLDLQLQSLEVQVSEDLERAFRTAIRKDAQAIITLWTPLISLERKRIVALAIKSRLPAIYDDREFVDAGGLMSYGANLEDLYRRAATYVDKILRGAKPAELPAGPPTKFELIINLHTATQIGLTIPSNVLARADKVIK
jgi:putative ABC transport system substrate-binding protein